MGGANAIGTGMVGSYDGSGNHGYNYNPVSYIGEGMLYECVGVVNTFILEPSLHCHTCMEGSYYCYCSNIRFPGK